MLGLKMLHHKAETLTYSGSTLSTFSGLWMWLGDNHDQIASLGVIFGMLFGFTGVIIQLCKLTIYIKNRKNL
jgi:hypothetical protein